MSVLFQPTGFNVGQGVPLMFTVRIYTTSYGIGRIQMDNVNITASQYQRIEQSDYYYYEAEITNNTHRLSTLDANANYSVGVSTVHIYNITCIGRIVYVYRL